MLLAPPNSLLSLSCIEKRFLSGNVCLEPCSTESTTNWIPVEPSGTPDFIFQQDGASCHTAKACQAWFRDNNVRLLEWPGNSPDLNPIENLWARLKKLVSQRHPSNKTELIEAIIESWHHVITAQELETLVNSMPDRYRAVIAAKGYATKY